MNKNKPTPTENEDLQAALEETDMMDDGDFGQQEIGDGWDQGLLDEDFDDEFFSEEDLIDDEDDL